MNLRVDHRRKETKDPPLRKPQGWGTRRINAPNAGDWNFAYELPLTVVFPKPEPPFPPLAVPLPDDACGAGPAAPPPTTGVAGAPKTTALDGCEPRYCEYPRQYKV